jgi:hypothetical protein
MVLVALVGILTAVARWVGRFEYDEPTGIVIKDGSTPPYRLTVRRTYGDWLLGKRLKHVLYPGPEPR